MAISGNQIPPARVRQRDEHARRLAHLMRDAIRRTQTKSNPCANRQKIINPNHQPSAHHAVEEREQSEGNQKQSEAIRGQSEAIRGNRCNQKPISSHQ